MAFDLNNGGNAKEATPDLNVTPLVDVVLVLLIIFMVVAPRLEQDVQVDLPSIFNADPDNKKSVEPLEIFVAADKSITVEEQPYTLDGLTNMLTQTRANTPTRKIALRADKSLPYLEARNIIAAVQKAGYPGAALMVAERATAAPKP